VGARVDNGLGQSAKLTSRAGGGDWSGAPGSGTTRVWDHQGSGPAGSRRAAWDPLFRTDDKDLHPHRGKLSPPVGYVLDGLDFVTEGVNCLNHCKKKQVGHHVDCVDRHHRHVGSHQRQSRSRASRHILRMPSGQFTQCRKYLLRHLVLNLSSPRYAEQGEMFVAKPRLS